MVLFVLSVLGAVAVSFLSSLAEATLLSLTPGQVAEISERMPRLGKTWQGLKQNIDHAIAGILILNTAAHTIGASITGSQFDSLFGERWIWLFALTYTFVTLQFTELLPKSLGVKYNRELAVVLGRPLELMSTALHPVLRTLHLINAPFERRRGARKGPAPLEEIAALAGLARLSQEIGAHQERIIKAASRLSELHVRDVMIPLEHVSFLSTTQNIAEALLAAHSDSHTRFPVCEAGDRQKVLGYLNFKEMIYFMRTNPHEPSLRGVIRPIPFVSPLMTAADLLRTCVEQHIHIAMVRDDLGTVLGLVTQEDLIEEIVGDLEDEFDRLPRQLHPLTGGVWMVGGGVPVGELAQRIGAVLEDAHGSTSAWLARRLKRLPRPGDIHREAGLEFQVRRVRRNKVFEIAVIKPMTIAEAARPA